MTNGKCVKFKCVDDRKNLRRIDDNNIEAPLEATKKAMITLEPT